MPLKTEKPPIVCIVGRSGSGKTTFLEKLIPEVRKKGLNVGTIKHHKHDFELDYPGKDSWRHKRAGSAAALISSPQRIGMVMDADHDYRPEELAPFLSGVDVILCEGYKRENRPKVEIFRPEVHDKPFCIDDKNPAVKPSQFTTQMVKAELVVSRNKYRRLLIGITHSIKTGVHTVIGPEFVTHPALYFVNFIRSIKRC